MYFCIFDTILEQNYYMNIENNSPNNNLNQKDSVGKLTGFFLFRGIINSYNEDKQKDEDARKEIKKYGRLSLTLGFISLFVSGSCLVSSISRFDLVAMSYVTMLIIYILCGILLSLLLSIYAFVFAVMQARLNRKSVGIIGIVLSIVDIGLCIALLLTLVL